MWTWRDCPRSKCLFRSFPRGFSAFSVFSEHFEKFLHILRERCLELYEPFCRRVNKFETVSVQRNSFYDRLLHSGVGVF